MNKKYNKVSSNKAINQPNEFTMSRMNGPAQNILEAQGLRDFFIVVFGDQ